ncbi:TPA_asm: hypothetical protein [Porphyromonas phage phage016a_WW2866]|uniref:Uncharacterized protein n=1 Tax=Porphyromonas phage phage016a_WW2866 TaxID=3154106 RepID=A0AAT9JBS8_9CAUD
MAPDRQERGSEEKDTNACGHACVRIDIDESCGWERSRKPAAAPSELRGCTAGRSRNGQGCFPRLREQGVCCHPTTTALRPSRYREPMHTTDQTQIPRGALAIPRRRARRIFR